MEEAVEPDGDKGESDADEEDGPPAEVGHDDGDDSATEGVADGPGGLDEGAGAAEAVGNLAEDDA